MVSSEQKEEDPKKRLGRIVPVGTSRTLPIGEGSVGRSTEMH